MRSKIKFDDNWKFSVGNYYPQKPTDGWGGAKARGYLKGAVTFDYDDASWRDVTLPHDFVSEGNYCFENGNSEDMVDIPEMESIDSRLFAGGCLDGSIAWYRKKFTLENCNNKRVYIHFDGIYRNSTVYVNEYFVGTHTSGYTGFYYDITDFVNLNGDNIIAVQVDATEREGWWYEGGGIYRHTWLETVDEIHIEQNSLFVSAESIDLKEKNSVINFCYTISNRSFENKDIHIKAEIKDSNNTVVSGFEQDLSLKEWSNVEKSEKLFMENIKLWDLDNPYLYTATVRIFENNNLCDEYNVNFGARDIRFDSDKGFFLNGNHIKIKGVCCHHDHAGVGIAIPDSVNEYRIKKLKEMGSNAFRSSHYPASPEVLDICDRLGMLVFSETRRMSSAAEDLECMKSMIKRDRNHPSIFLWGIGNEEVFSQHRPETERATRTMKAEVRKLDSTRPITSAVVCWDGEQRYDNAEKYVNVTKNLDVMGFNYCQSAWDDYHKRVPVQPIIITEESSNSWTRACYCTDESIGQYYAYDGQNFDKCQSKGKAVRENLGENAWKAVAERDYLAGMFVWTGFDYRGEPTPLKYPAVYTQFGIFDYCGFPKDNYYYYKSWWTNENVLHIFSDNTVDNEHVNVFCYSNLDEVELFIDDKSYGKKEVPRNWYVKWEDVDYKHGSISVKGYKNGEFITEETMQTVGKPYQISIKAESDAVKKGDAAIFNISILDENGFVVPNANNELIFEVKDGELLGTGNGNPGDHDNEKTNKRRAFNGLCQLIVRADNDNQIKINVSSDGLTSSQCTVKII